MLAHLKILRKMSRCWIWPSSEFGTILNRVYCSLHCSSWALKMFFTRQKIRKFLKYSFVGCTHACLTLQNSTRWLKGIIKVGPKVTMTIDHDHCPKSRFDYIVWLTSDTFSGVLKMCTKIWTLVKYVFWWKFEKWIYATLCLFVY